MISSIFMRTGFLKAILLLLFIPAVFAAGCSKEIKPAESPEEVVRKFYSYVREGGTTTLSEAYRLVDARQGKVEEDSFKRTVSNYPKDMEVKVVNSSVDGKNGKAVVTIEYRVASAFGDYMTSRTDVNLLLDREAKAWKIDFAGESYEENPGMYSGK